MQDTQIPDDNRPIIDTEPSTVADQTVSHTPDPTIPNIAKAYIVPVTKSHTKLIVGIVSVFVFLLGALGGSAYWYFSIRTPDIEYERASAVIDSMIDDAKSLQNAGSTLQESTDAKTTLTSVVKFADTQVNVGSALKTINEATGKASEYLISQNKLESLRVIANDQSVAAVYAANKKVINEYGMSSDILYRTAYAFLTLYDQCIVNESIIPTGIKSADTYDQKVKLCKDYLDNTKTVPSKDFNDTIYVPYREIILSYIANVSSLYSEVAGSKAWNQAYQNILKVSRDVQAVDTSKVQTLKNTQNPKDHLVKLKAKIDERKSVVFR